MKAVVFHEHGGIEKLVYTDFPMPKIESNQVLVNVKAVALNHLDLFVRQGWPGLNLELPHILGSDIAGVIAEVGADVQGVEIGQKVIVDPNVYCGVCEFCLLGEHSLCREYAIIGEHRRGGYAEFVAIQAANTIPIPEESSLNFAQAAAVPLTFMTAWRMLMTKARLRAGQDILIIGIGGGVALAAMQIAKVVGARVFVTSSSDEKLEKAKKLGADFCINYREKPDWHKEIFDQTKRRGVDVVVDSAGQATWEKSLRSLRKGGRLVTCGATTGPMAQTNISLLFWKQLEILGSTMGSRSELRDVLKLVWDQKLKPVVDQVLLLSEAKKAHQILKEGKQFGKLVLEP
ncbi:MAG: zinc-binding dehydrogenase [Candidatus Hermodarchaeota archaeon]